MAEKNLIWAQTLDGTIALNGQVPWRQKADLRFFKQVTIHEMALMGRNTMKSLHGRPLPNRLNVVLTHDEGLVVPEGFQKVYSLKEADQLADSKNLKLQVIGGKAIYDSFLAIADTLYVTYLQTDFTGDVKMPPVDQTIWQAEIIDEGSADDDNDYAWHLVKYTRF